MKTQDIIHRSADRFWQKWFIAFKILPLVLLVAVLKILAHIYGWEIMDLNALFTSLVGGTIFLIGFLISGVLADYKESERMPSELAASITTLIDDGYTIYREKDSDTALVFMEFQRTFLNTLVEWFFKRARTSALLGMLADMNDFFVAFDKEGVMANYIIRMKTEQHNLRKTILRIDTIRDTDFAGSAYAIVEAMGFVIPLGLIATRIEPFYASISLTLLLTFLITYMLLLIRDLDNPFSYAQHGETGTEIPLKPLHDLLEDLDNKAAN
jgi:hypothetical protein